MPMKADTAELDAILDKMDANELSQVQKHVTALISDYNERKRRDAISAAEEAAKQHGFKLGDLVTGQKSGKTRAKPSPAKYANPANPDQTWSGRGRRPNWVTEALDAGRNLEEFAL